MFPPLVSISERFSMLSWFTASLEVKVVCRLSQNGALEKPSKGRERGFFSCILSPIRNSLRLSCVFLFNWSLFMFSRGIKKRRLYIFLFCFVSFLKWSSPRFGFTAIQKCSGQLHIHSFNPLDSAHHRDPSKTLDLSRALEAHCILLRIYIKKSCEAWVWFLGLVLL